LAQNPVQIPFRLGTSSYILPDDILPNARYLADRVDDIELVLFEVDEGPNNLPGPETISELIGLARRHDLTYTVHLPLDLRLGSSGEESHVSLEKARKVIDRTRDLHPHAYVLHLDGREARQSSDPRDLAAWQNQAARALDLVAGWAGAADLLAVENLEGYPPAFNLPVLERVPAGICLDVGHLWRDGYDPVEWLEVMLPRTKVIHIHGVGERDHQSLAHMPPSQLDEVFRYLIRHRYSGVVTMEIFSKPDFETSLKAIQECLLRIGDRPGGEAWQEI
jgi:sugar phosphate isomerase/epimerase